MRSLRLSWLCARLTLSRWSSNPRIITLSFIIFAFLAYHSHSLVRFAAAVDEPLTPWIFPHLLTPAVLLTYGAFTLLLFCDAPFIDNHTPFIIIRSGRSSWLNGQIMYIACSSLIYLAFFLISSVLVLVPNVAYSGDWGIIIKTLASDSSLPARYHLNVTVFFSEAIIKDFTPWQAILISCVLFWLTTVFTGLVIFTFNLLSGKASGLFVAGSLICMTYFSGVQGRLVFGDWIAYLSPLSWVSMHNIRWGSPMPYMLQPGIFFVLGTLISLSILMIIVVNIAFRKQDINTRKGGQINA